MALEVKKQNRETTQSLVRRFTRMVQRSGILVRAREVRYRQRKKSEQMKRRSALRREELRREYEMRKKMGEL